MEDERDPLMSSFGLSVFRSVLAASMAWITSKPADARPKIVCLSSSQGAGTVVMKNWLPVGERRTV